MPRRLNCVLVGTDVGHGPWMTFNNDGSVHAEGERRNGRQHGKFIQWRDSRRKLRWMEEEWDNGTRVTQLLFEPDGT